MSTPIQKASTSNPIISVKKTDPQLLETQIEFFGNLHIKTLATTYQASKRELATSVILFNEQMGGVSIPAGGASIPAVLTLLGGVGHHPVIVNLRSAFDNMNSSRAIYLAGRYTYLDLQKRIIVNQLHFSSINIPTSLVSMISDYLDDSSFDEAEIVKADSDLALD